MDVLDALLTFFEAFGPAGSILFLFTIFFLDAMLVPTLPELFVMSFFASRPTWEWGLTLLLVVTAAEVLSNGFLYALVKRRGLPAFVERRMRQWVDFLVVSDERIILVNRVAPVIPLMGAFIATMKWDVRKSLFYVGVGSLAKYGLLMALVSLLFAYLERTTARNFTLAAIVLVVAVSFVQGQMTKRKRLGASAAGAKGGKEPSRPASPAPGQDE